MIIKCKTCGRDPAARWRLQPAMMFADGIDADGRRQFSCRDHLSEKREAEIKARERALNYSPGALR